MTLSYTRIFTPDGSMFSVPNSQLLDGEYKVGVTYSVTPNSVVEVPLPNSTLLDNRLITSPWGDVEHRTPFGVNISGSDVPFFIEFNDGRRAYVVPSDVIPVQWNSVHARKLLPEVLRPSNIAGQF